jgi:hypothetical protein
MDNVQKYNNWYKYYVVGHYPSSCLYPKTSSCLFFKKHNVSESGFCLRLQLKPTRWGPIHRASLRPKIWTSSIDWAQLNRFYLKTVTESSLRNVAFWKINRTVFWDKDRTMDNVQQHNICTNVPLSQTFWSYWQKAMSKYLSCPAVCSPLASTAVGGLQTNGRTGMWEKNPQPISCLLWHWNEPFVVTEGQKTWPGLIMGGSNGLVEGFTLQFWL